VAMSWRFHKTFRKGIWQTSVTKNGVGFSVELFGLCRVGLSARGQFFLSFGIPKTGFYWIQYFGKPRKSSYLPVPKRMKQKPEKMQEDQNLKPMANRA
jgi:hypothetical protein